MMLGEVEDEFKRNAEPIAKKKRRIEIETFFD
jgi:hypothetical protein